MDNLDTAFRAACNTLIAPTWKVYLAHLFGEKRQFEDAGITVTLHKWRGVVYLTAMSKLKESSNG